MLCGWLSPKGEFYPCDSYSHIRLSYELANTCCHADPFPEGRPDDFLLASSWLKLYQDGLASANPLTDEQVKWLSRETGHLSYKQERSFCMYLDWEKQKV